MALKKQRKGKSVGEIKTEEVTRFGYSGEIEVKEKTMNPSFKGANYLSRNKIEISYDPSYAEKAKDLEDIIEEPFSLAITKIIQHELNHKGGGSYKGCPRTQELGIKNVLEPVAEVLSGLGFQNVLVSDEKDLYGYMENLIEDLFLHFELMAKDDPAGIFLVYKDFAGEKATPFFTAFVKLQEIYSRSKTAKKLMQKHYAEDPKVDEVISTIMQKTGWDSYLKELTTKRKKERVKIFDRGRILNDCLNENNWPQLAKIIAEEFAKLLDKSKLDQPEYLKAIFLPFDFCCGTGHKDDDLIMKCVWEKYRDAEKCRDPEHANADDPKPGTPNFRPPPYLENYTALDLVYRKLGRNLEIKTKASTTQIQMPVVGFGKRPFDPETDDIRKAGFGISREGKMQLQVKQHHQCYPVEYTERQHALPGIRFVQLDTSGSMRDPVNSEKKGVVMNPWALQEKQWNSNSKYHYALIAWYGLLELLRKQGTLKHTSIKLANYSETTEVAHNLQEAKKLALNPQFGNTKLDLERVRDLFGKNNLVISLTDGDLHNWGTIKEQYISLAQQNHYFHLQIGERGRMCLDLETAGLSVIYDTGLNLGKIVVDLTRPFITRRVKK